MTDAPTTMQDLRAARQRAELRQADVGKLLGLQASYVSLLETSRDVLPTPEFVARWMAAVAAAEAGTKAGVMPGRVEGRVPSVVATERRRAAAAAE